MRKDLPRVFKGKDRADLPGIDLRSVTLCKVPLHALWYVHESPFAITSNPD